MSDGGNFDRSTRQTATRALRICHSKTFGTNGASGELRPSLFWADCMPSAKASCLRLNVSEKQIAMISFERKSGTSSRIISCLEIASEKWIP